MVVDLVVVMDLLQSQNLLPMRWMDLLESLLNLKQRSLAHSAFAVPHLQTN